MLDELELNIVSYTLLAVLAALLVLPVLFAKEPDIHPMALLRHSAIAPIRNPKESAIHRSIHTPFGYPLVSGLGLPTEKKYSTRDGDIRDIWKLAVEKGSGKMLSVKGDDLEQHDMNKLTKDIHALGSYIQSIGAKRVAIYLSNDVENIVATFAAAFYNLTLLVLPFDPKGAPSTNTLLNRTNPDVLIAPAGLLPLDDLAGAKIKQVIYVVEEASQHLGWDAPPGSPFKSTTYHEIIQAGSATVVENEIDLDGPAVVVCGTKISGGVKEIEFVEFSHRNIIAGVATHLASIPKSEHLGPQDVFLPADSLGDLYTRILTYAALSKGATLALNPVAGRNADLDRVVQTLDPTVIVCSTNTLLRIHSNVLSNQMEIWHKILHHFQTRTLTIHGCIPKGNFLTRLNDYDRPLGASSRVRLVFTAESAGDPESSPITSQELSDLRAFFGAKVVYGLKHYKVAGAITQWNVFDYRILPQEQNQTSVSGVQRKCTHFGGVVPGCEVKTVDSAGWKAADPNGSAGEIVVSGPVVAGGEIRLGVLGRWRSGALEYV